MPLHIIRQDITKMECDAIVNPSNEDLIPGGGVDAAIHAGAGESLEQACAEIGGCPIGEARITAAYNLPCKYVIHTAGPVWCGGVYGERENLESCYHSCLKLAKENKFESVAFPLISSGTYGYPKDQVLKLAIAVISEFLFENELTVYLVVFDKTAYQFSEKLFSDITSFIDDNYVEEYLEFSEYLPIGVPSFEAFFDAESDMADRCREPELKDSEEEAHPKTASLNMSNPTIAKPLLEEKGVFVANKTETLNDWLTSLDESFAEALFRLIDAKGMSDVECYKKANVDKRTFSKIKSNEQYKPSKITVLSFAIALELDLEETQHLLRTVGLSLSRSNKFDVIIEYFITNKVYDIFTINEALFEFDQVCLGAMA